MTEGEFIFGLGQIKEKPVPEIKLQFHKTKVFAKVNKSLEVAEFIRALYPEGSIELQEHVFVLYLDRSNQIIGYYHHSKGGVDGTIMDIRLILSTALKSLSTSIIIAHNHPSGNLKPSDSDLSITKRIKEGAALLEIKLLDHLVITKDGHYSFADEGLLGLDGLGKAHTKSGSADKKQPEDREKIAREAAKRLIGVYVKRGDSEDHLRNSQMGTSNSEFEAHIKGNKIHVTSLGRKKVDYSFPLHSIYNEIREEIGMKTSNKPAQKKQTPIKRSTPVKRVKQNPPVKVKALEVKQVERVDDEIRLIKRYALLHGKIKTDVQVLNFLNTVEKAILERRIRKTSPYAKEIEYIQTNLAKLYNVMEDKVEIKVNKEVLERFLAIGGSEKVRLSITYLKRYIGLQGKKITKEKVQRLIDLMKGAVKRGVLTKADPYIARLNNAYMSLLKFVEKAKGNDTLEIHPAVLNGINDALDGCDCEEGELDGIDQEIGEPGLQVVHSKQKGVMNSMDFVNEQFETLGFMGKWRDLIGDPCPGFTAMVFGRPKMGKSYLCMDFAGYLARNHGKTLYVAEEEKLDATLQKKLTDLKTAHSDLDVAETMLDDLSPYQFIVLDSVNKLGLQPEDLDRLKAKNPGKSFIYVFQTTKDGRFRGSQHFQHDVDVVIEVPEKGKAVQFGRFNQGGEMRIFDREGQQTEREFVNKEIPSLMGIEKAKSSRQKRRKFDILSPDGFSIRIGVEPFDSIKEAKEYFNKWKERYRIQGYYSSVPYGRIHLDDLMDYCSFVEWNDQLGQLNQVGTKNGGFDEKMSA